MAMGPKVAVKFAFENPGQLNQILYITYMIENLATSDIL